MGTGYEYRVPGIFRCTFLLALKPLIRTTLLPQHHKRHHKRHHLQEEERNGRRRGVGLHLQFFHLDGWGPEYQTADMTFQMKVPVYKNTKFLNDHRKSVKEEAKKRSKELLQQAFLEMEGGCD
jgi:hypothetical protein